MRSSTSLFLLLQVKEKLPCSNQSPHAKSRAALAVVMAAISAGLLEWISAILSAI
jgi:hypothetical protein